MAEIGHDIEKAASLLKEGKLVAIPTETVYGLAANGLNADAVIGIFEAKNRPFFDPLILHTASIAGVEAHVSAFPQLARQLAKEFWPGPLSLILPKKNSVPDIVTAGLGTVAFRIPNHRLTLELLKRLPFPLAAPSANPFGYVSPTTAKHVNDQLGDSVDYILDGGSCEVGLESTIVSFGTGNTPVILRLGGLDVARIAKITGKIREILHQNSDPSAPGQLDQHYAPGCILIPAGENPRPWQMYKGKKTALVRFQHIEPDFPKQHQFILAADGSLKTAAANLFSILRLLDTKEYEIAIVETIADEGLGRAINDRLRRATAR
jgi:L-threonylcarbamoyladenylate synthase